MAATVKQEDVLHAHRFAEMLIEDNTKSIENLVGVISLLKPVKEKLCACLGSSNEVAQLDTATLDYQTKSQELARLTEVVNTLEQQHTDISRLYVAWAITRKCVIS